MIHISYSWLKLHRAKPGSRSDPSRFQLTVICCDLPDCSNRLTHFMPNLFRTLDGKTWKPKDTLPLSLADGTQVEGVWTGSAQDEKRNWWIGQPGAELAQSDAVAAVATKSDDTKELLWLDAPSHARLFFIVQAREPGKSYRRALMLTVAATAAQMAYLHHDRFSLFGRFKPDGAIERIAPLPPPPPRPALQGELF